MSNGYTVYIVMIDDQKTRFMQAAGIFLPSEFCGELLESRAESPSVQDDALARRLLDLGNQPQVAMVAVPFAKSHAIKPGLKVLHEDGKMVWLESLVKELGCESTLEEVEE